jgi:HEAT repeat protein
MRCLGWALSALVLSTAGCGSSGTVQAALHGDLGALRREIQREQRAGSLDRGRVVSLAEAIAAREVMSGSGPSGVRRIRVMRGCTPPLLDVLRARAERQDDGGAEAAQVLVTARALDDRSSFARYADSSSGAWRAVAARSARYPAAFERRRSYFVDPDERVRRAAFEAALEAPSAQDLEILLESARLDPDPLSQSLAARGVGAVGGERAVLALLDRWDRADEETRLAIVDAWSMPRAYESGGERELVKVAERGIGLPALAASEGLLRAGGSHAATATTLFARAIADGSAEERRYAIRVAPLENAEIKRLIGEAAKGGDSQVKVIALARQLELPTERARATKELEQLTKGDASVARQARAALAANGDASVKPALLKLLDSTDRIERSAAAMGLIRLGDYGSAARVLADEDATLRATFSCTILAREERAR